MTPLDNFHLLRVGESPQRIPFTLDVGAGQGFTRPVLRRFERETGASDPAEYFDFDFRTASVAKRRAVADPERFHADVPVGTSFDEWCIGHWAGGAEGTYEKMLHPLQRARTVREIEAFPEPVLDASGVAERVRAFHARGYPVCGYAGSVYEWSWWARGMETFMTDLLAEPDLARAVIAKVASFTKRLALATADAGMDVLCFYDDAGMQSGMQISPALWRAFIRPAWREILDAVRARRPDATLFLHSCGNIHEIVPDIVDLGFHILHPLQTECMDAARVKREFGDRLIPCATLGAQRVFSFGSLDDVRREVRRLIETLGYDRRCILCPGNAIQPETPWENIVAFVEAAREGSEAEK